LFAAAIIEARSVQLRKQSSLFSPRPSSPSRPFEFTPNGARRLPTKFIGFHRLRGKENNFKFSSSIKQIEFSVLRPKAANGGDCMLTDVGQSRKLWRQQEGDGQAVAEF